MRKKIFRGLGLAVLGIMMITMAKPSYATNDIEDAKKEKEEMEEQLKDTEAALDSLESLKGDTEEYIEAMDGYLSNLINNIYAIEADVTAKKEQIEAKKAEIVSIEEDIAKQYQAMKLRIRYMYENGEVSYMSMFFESEDMSDFLNRAEYLSKITSYDRDMLTKLEETEDILNMNKLALDGELKDLEDMLAEVEEEKAAAEVLVEAKRQQLEATSADIADKEAAIKAQKEEIAAQEALIKELEEIERKRKEEAEKLQQNLGNMYSGGTMTWPLPGYSYISSDFGYRSDPFTGLESYHSGIDIPAPTGTPIVAACSGQVAWAYYSSSAGNWIGIDHGNGLYTIYMHMSQLLVSEGEMVTAGQTIGLCGTTGRSTGPHLHFSVRLNGSYVNPFNYTSP